MPGLDIPGEAVKMFPKLMIALLHTNHVFLRLLVTNCFSQFFVFLLESANLFDQII